MSVATLPPPQTTENADGTQTIVSFKINDAGNKVKVTRKVRLELREASTPESRRTWAKFGDAAHEQIKPQVEDEIALRLFPKTAKSDGEGVRDEKKSSGKKLSCSYCHNEHLTFQCPLRDKLATAGGAPGAPGGPGGSGLPPSVSERMGAGRPGQMTPGGAPGKYVPPALRGSMGGPMGGPMGSPMGGPMGGKYVTPAMRTAMAAGMPGLGMGMNGERDDTATLRVSNLPDEIQENDLRQNFGQLGRIVRCHLARNKITNRSRGFAFIVYSVREEAERARKRFDGVPVGNMIMHVDFAQPRE